MKALRWHGLVAYVGRLEVGRIERSSCAGTDADMWVSMLGEFARSPLGILNIEDMENTARQIRRGKDLVEDNWKEIARLMSSNPE